MSSVLKRYLYWLSGISFFVAIVVVLGTDRADIVPTGPIAWWSVASEWGIGIPMMFVGFSLMQTPEALLNWLAKHVPWWHPPEGSIRAYGCFTLLLGSLSVGVGVLRIVSAFRILTS
jgi:hypothetical protein